MKKQNKATADGDDSINEVLISQLPNRKVKNEI